MRWFLLLFLSVSAWAQIISGNISVSGNMQVKVGTGPILPVLPPGFATLPQTWANDKECGTSTSTYDHTKHVPADYATIQAAWAAWQSDGVDDSWKVIVPHGSVNGPLTALAKLVSGNMPTKCFVVDSDTPLTADRTVCAHGIQDNVASSTDPGVRNPDCDGSALSYQLGQTLTSIPAGPFTLANGTSTNTSAYNDVFSMYIIECNTLNCAAVVSGPVDANGNGPNHFAIFNAEIRVNSSKTCCFGVQLQNAGATVESLPSHYHFDRVWIHSNATDLGAGTQSLTDGIRVNCGGNCSFSNSQISKIIRPGAEGHGVYWSDAQQLKVVHNWVEGASINIFDGGISASVPGGVSGRDVEIRRNRFTYPLPWLGHGSGISSVCGSNVSCVRKNCTEMKGAQRYLYDGNICENVDNSGGQNGTLSDWNNRACTPTICNNYEQTIQNITATNNIYRHGCGGMLFDANSGNPGSSGNSASTPGRNFYLANVLMYDISVVNFSCGVTTNGTFYLGGANHDFPVTSVTRNGTGTVSTIVLTGGTGENFTGLVPGDPITLTGCADTTFNVGPHPYVYALSVSGTTITYPNVGTANATTAAGCSFNNGAGWPNYVQVDHVTAVADNDIYVGNNLTAPNATFPRNITYLNSIFTGTRGFGNGGGTEGTTFQTDYFDTTTMLVHHTLYGQRVAPTWQSGTVYKLGQVVQPSGSPAHFYTAVTSGTSGGSQPAFSGTANSCTTDNTVVWQENGFRISQTGGLPNYTEYDVLNTPVSPPTTLYFPQTDFTYGATADATSIGFTGALNAPTTGTNSCVAGTQVKVNYALDLSDWHGYVLDSSSAYKGLGTLGTDLGVSIPALDTAQTSTQYVCQSTCGAGPTQD